MPKAKVPFVVVHERTDAFGPVYEVISTGNPTQKAAEKWLSANRQSKPGRYFVGQFTKLVVIEEPTTQSGEPPPPEATVEVEEKVLESPAAPEPAVAPAPAVAELPAEEPKPLTEDQEHFLRGTPKRSPELSTGEYDFSQW